MDEKTYKARVKSVTAGFIISLALTLTAYIAVMYKPYTGDLLVGAVIVLALAQFLAQMIFFLHIGKGSRWNTLVFFGMMGVVAILVVGSLWIMANLEYMTGREMTERILKEEDIRKN